MPGVAHKVKGCVLFRLCEQIHIVGVKCDIRKIDILPFGISSFLPLIFSTFWYLSSSLFELLKFWLFHFSAFLIFDILCIRAFSKIGIIFFRPLICKCFGIFSPAPVCESECVQPERAEMDVSKRSALLLVHLDRVEWCVAVSPSVSQWVCEWCTKL